LLVFIESVTNSLWFLRTLIIFFLNKIGIFKSKLTKVRCLHLCHYYATLTCPFSCRCRSHLRSTFRSTPWARYQQSCHIYIMVLHASESRTIERLPSVSPLPISSSSQPSANYCARFLQSHASNGYDQHLTCIRCRQRDHIAECSQGLWYTVSAAAVGSSSLCCPIALCKSILGCILGWLRSNVS